MCKFFNSYEESLHLGVCKLAKYVINCVVFWENLHSWQKFYTTADRDSRDKFQVCLRGGRWSWEVGGDLGKIGVRGDSAGHWADGTTAWKMLFTYFCFLLTVLRMSLQDSETFGDVTALQRVQILGEHLGIIFSGWFGTILLRQLFEISFQILSQVLCCSTTPQF